MATRAEQQDARGGWGMRVLFMRVCVCVRVVQTLS